MKTMRFLAAFAAAACLMMACDEKITPDDPTPGKDPSGQEQPVTVDDEVSVSPATVTFAGEGGTFRVAVTTNADDYTVSGAAEWLTVEKSGKELTLTAAANTVAEVRSCTLTVAAGTASTTVAVSQQAGSPYPGYIVSIAAELEYSGTMLYQFMKPKEENYGGWAYLGLVDEDQNTLALWIYTDLFKTEEEVELTTGTYTKGQDDYTTLSLYAKPLTYMAGGVMPMEDEDEPFYYGSYVVSATGETVCLVDGTIEVSRDGDIYTILVDMKGEDDNDYKYVHIGEVGINTEDATYPSEVEHIDVASTIYGAAAIYCGDAIGNGTTTLQLQLYSGDPENPAMTQFTFITESMEYAEDFDLSGDWATPENEADAYNPGAVVSGSMVELMPGFEMPMGTYIMYSWGDYLMGDGYNSLSLMKQDDGKYTLVGVIMSEDGDMVMFFGDDFTGIHDLEIPFFDGTQEED